jgi:psp operon transcriptional activator
VAATNADLPSLAAKGRFRADLLDRLAFDVLTLPPLRERQDDIEVLAEHMALKMAQELRRDIFPGFTPKAMAILRGHPWPGNVRELKNVVERAVYRTEVGQKVEDIVLDPFASPWRLPDDTPARASDTPSAPAQSYDFVQYINDMEKDLLQKALTANAHHQKNTAAFLKMTYHQFRNQLLKHGLIGREKEPKADRAQ